MRVINLKEEGIPFPEEEFSQIANTIYQMNQDKINNLGIAEELECIHIFNQKDIDYLNGFKIQVFFIKNEDTSVNMYIKELILFDDEDEWLTEYKSLKSLKSQ